MTVTQKLERISRKIFEKYKKEVIQYIGSKPGVYALYDEKELYYAGRASDLAKRVNRHLKDQHSALWTHFSVYLVKKAQYANDIEAVVISIANPKGNKAKPKLEGEKGQLNNFLRKAIKIRHQKELKELGLGRKKRVELTKKSKNRPDLKNYFETDRPLMKSYKGNMYKAVLLTSGMIKDDGGTEYKTPSKAAQKIAGLKTVNGWSFWFVKNSENNWVKLRDLD